MVQKIGGILMSENLKSIMYVVTSEPRSFYGKRCEYQLRLTGGCLRCSPRNCPYSFIINKENTYCCSLGVNNSLIADVKGGGMIYVNNDRA